MVRRAIVRVDIGFSLGTILWALLESFGLTRNIDRTSHGLHSIGDASRARC